MDGKGNSLIVVGAGVWGLSCAFACAKRGWDVTVLERERVGAGASGGIVGAMAPHTPDQWNPKKQFQFEALVQAAPFWAEVERLSGQPTGYGRIGRLQPIVTAAAKNLASARAQTAQELWHGNYTWSVEDRPNWLTADVAPHGVIRDSLSARIHPAKATAALAMACKAVGVQVEEGVAIHDLPIDGAARQADAVIIAAGVDGFDLLTPHTSKHPGKGQKGQAALLQCDLRQRPQLYADGLYIVPHADGTTAVGSTSENTFDEPNTTDEQLDDILAKACATLPELHRAKVLQRWARMRPKPRKRDPMLGPIPGLPQHYAALGAFKIGFGIAAKVGETLADCLEGKGQVPSSFLVASHTA